MEKQCEQAQAEKEEINLAFFFQINKSLKYFDFATLKVDVFVSSIVSTGNI